MALLREAAESYLEVAKQRWKAMQPRRAQLSGSNTKRKKHNQGSPPFLSRKQLSRIQQLPQASVTIALCELCAVTDATRALTEGTNVGTYTEFLVSITWHQTNH